MWRVVFLGFLTGILSVDAASSFFRSQLPIYLQQCSKSSPYLNDCIVSNGNKAIPRIVKGDKRFKIPKMVPLQLSEVIVSDDQNLRFILRNAEIYGLENTRIISANLDLPGNSYSYNLTNPKLTIIGDYEMSGYILESPVNGIGRANITLISGLYSHSMKFVVDKSQYASILFPKLTYRTKRNNYQFTNLLKGNDFLGYQTNIYLNNNWREVSNIFSPRISKLMNDLLVSIHKNLALASPIDEIFLP